MIEFIPRTLGQILSDPLPEPQRLPIRNREPREQMGGRKWHLIWERDGQRCKLCGNPVPKGLGEIDHIVPRSSFSLEDLGRADRSDNLQVACISCNQEKSNFAPVERDTGVGVTSACWDCLVGVDADGEYDFDIHGARPILTVPAYCGRCGFTWVPDVTWLL